MWTESRSKINHHDEEQNTLHLNHSCIKWFYISYRNWIDQLASSTTSILCPASFCLQHSLNSPRHRLNKSLDQFMSLIVSYFLQYLAISVSRFQTLEWMVEHLNKAFIKAIFESNPEIFDQVEIWRLRRSLHDRDMVFLKEFQHFCRFMAWNVVLHEQINVFIRNLYDSRVLRGF